MKFRNGLKSQEDVIFELRDVLFPDPFSPSSERGPSSDLFVRIEDDGEVLRTVFVSISSFSSPSGGSSRNILLGLSSIGAILVRAGKIADVRCITYEGRFSNW